MPAFDDSFARVKQLVADFEAGKAHFLSPQYQEQEARHDFIDKFWIALGWDVNHETQKNPFEQEVKVERKEHGTSQRRADYAFYLAPNFRDVKFYVEAKKPYGDIATADNYFQAARYGWSSHTPLAVLNDFEQFEIVDCRYRPHIDTALAQNVRKYHYSHYLDSEKFAQIYWLFSREAVANGSLEKFAETLPKKRGRAVQRGLFPGAIQSIDDAFLEELDEHREALAKAFKNENPDLDGETLTELTQRTLDRLVFLRFLEDKHIEPQNHIAYFGDKGSAWQDFIRESRRLDGIYNGIVYKEHPILDKPSFKPDDEIFSAICERLAHINSPYDFNAVPIHILGSIYERFLGKVIVTTDKRARVEEKPAVRKAGGVYYTPEYIVRYIVENTVGKLIEGKTPSQISELRFADIACGSGSFLLGVYDLLLRYHTKYYNENPGKAKIGGKGKKEQKADCVERDDGLHLSLQKKREILVNNIFGVDIDAQAVEVAQLSLYLKLLQDETPGSTREHQMEFHEALLPTLNKNIVCGNSLVGTDILDGQFFAGDEERKLNPMNFQDAFPHFFKRKPGGELKDAPVTPLDFDFPGMPLHGSYSKKKLKNAPKAQLPPEFQGGFDAIVGNPPYVRMEEFKPIKDYLRTRYRSHEERADFYTYFIERGLSLIRTTGLFGMIVSNKFAAAKYGEPLRRTLHQNAEIREITDFAGANVFKGATVRTFILLASRKAREQHGRTRYVPVPPSDKFEQIEKGTLLLKDYAGAVEVFLDPEQIGATPWQFIPAGDAAFLKRLTDKFPKLSEAYGWKPLFGIKTGLNEAFVIDRETRARIIREDRASAEVIKPFLFGKDVKRYEVHDEGRFVIYLHPEKNPKDFPSTKRHLENYRSQLSERAATQEWYELQQPAVGLIPLLRKPKIIYPIIAPEPRFSLDSEGFLINDKLFVLPTDSLFLLGVLNSRLAHFFFSSVCARLEGSGDCYYEYRAQFVEKFPTRKIDFSHEADKSRHDRMVQFVEQMLEAKKQLAAAQMEKDRTYFENKCTSLDRQINALVYDLYGLTEAEIKIVEGAAA
jgi:adenine-specific DNA-methyltransferase